MYKSIVILVNFKDGVYPEIEPAAYETLIDNEECAIRDFLENCITRANRYKEHNNHYPENIENLKSWEELN